MKTDKTFGKSNKYKIGLPIISKSYKAKTPKKLKYIGDGLVFIGSLITILTASATPPGWVAIVSGATTLTGRFIIKCIGEN